ncbi:unnamed protein product [Pleuronectes platessa]|uniref:Uncharacterized protein n=1 Tax=Pleuronectes platessa TaxID=8262 RepID=A0A9N7VXN9_PLEPL|nr:unnamed protein product [Pleuronectes platessa]
MSTEHMRLFDVANAIRQRAAGHSHAGHSEGPGHFLASLRPQGSKDAYTGNQIRQVPKWPTVSQRLSSCGLRTLGSPQIPSAPLICTTGGAAAGTLGLPLVEKARQRSKRDSV